MLLRDNETLLARGFAIRVPWKDGGGNGISGGSVDAAMRQGLDLNAPTRRWYRREGGCSRRGPRTSSSWRRCGSESGRTQAEQHRSG